MKNLIIVLEISILVSLTGCAKKKLEGVEEEEAFRKVEVAIHAGDTNKMKSLLKTNPEFISATDYNGRSLLHEAIIDGRKNVLEMVKLLVSSGADVNAKDLSGNTPLHSATASTSHRSVENARVMEFLIEQGADVNAMNNSGKPPMSNAAGYLPSGKIAADILKKHGARPY